MYCLGWNYSNGEGVEQNMTEAIRWYTAAAEGGNADAMHDLGGFTTTAKAWNRI